MKKESEFGKGFIYNLVLFSKHYWKYKEYLESYEKINKNNSDLFTKKKVYSM